MIQPETGLYLIDMALFFLSGTTSRFYFSIFNAKQWVSCNFFFAIY